MPAGKLIRKRETINNVYGFFIGVDEYMKPIRRLEGCVRDAIAISEAFNPSEKTVLLYKKATRATIFKTVQNYISSLGKGDLLIVYFGGHGYVINNVNKELVFLPSDAKKDNLLGTAVSTMYLMNALSDLSNKGCKVLVIFDICYSGTLNFDLSKYMGTLSGGGISAIYSAGPNETANEIKFGEETRGVFTYYLTEGLNGAADVDKNGFITLRDLYDYIYQNVCARKQEQHPALIGTLEGNTILKTLD